MVTGISMILKLCLAKAPGSVNVQNRTSKLFYVALTRAMKNLIIFMPNDDKQIVEKASDFFESSDIINIQDLEK